MGWWPNTEFSIRSKWTIKGALSEVQAVLHDPVALSRWWSPVFLRAEVVEGSEHINLEGMIIRFLTKGFLPFTFQFSAVVERNDSDELRVRTCGDFDGVGVARTRQVGDSVQIDITWTVVVHQPYLRLLLLPLKPIFVMNHRWAMRQGEIGLREEVAARRALKAPFVRKPTFPHNIVRVRDAYSWSREDRTWAG